MVVISIMARSCGKSLEIPAVEAEEQQEESSSEAIKPENINIRHQDERREGKVCSQMGFYHGIDLTLRYRTHHLFHHLAVLKQEQGRQGLDAERACGVLLFIDV